MRRRIKRQYSKPPRGKQRKRLIRLGIKKVKVKTREGRKYLVKFKKRSNRSQ